MPTSSQALNLLKQFNYLSHTGFCYPATAPDNDPLPTRNAFFYDNDGKPYPVPSGSYYGHFRPSIDPEENACIAEEDSATELETRFRFLTLPPIGKGVEPFPPSILKDTTKERMKVTDQVVSEQPEGQDNEKLKTQQDGQTEKICQNIKKRVGVSTFQSVDQSDTVNEKKGLSYVSVIWYNDAVRVNHKRWDPREKRLRFSDEINISGEYYAEEPNFEIRTKSPHNSSTCSDDFGTWKGRTTGKQVQDNISEALAPLHYERKDGKITELLSGKVTEGSDPANSKKVPLTGNTLSLKVDAKCNETQDEGEPVDKTSCKGVLSYSPRSGRYSWNLEPQNSDVSKQNGWRTRSHPNGMFTNPLQSISDINYRRDLIKSRWKSLSKSGTIDVSTKSYSGVSIETCHNVSVSTSKEKYSPNRATAKNSQSQLHKGVALPWGKDNVYLFETDSHEATVDEEYITFFTGNAGDLVKEINSDDHCISTMTEMNNNQSWLKKDQVAQFPSLPVIMETEPPGIDQACIQHEGEAAEKPASSAPAPSNCVDNVDTASKLQRLTCSGVINTEDICFRPQPGDQKCLAGPQTVRLDLQGSKKQRRQSDSNNERSFSGLTPQQKKAAQLRKIMQERPEPPWSPANTDEELFGPNYLRRHDDDDPYSPENSNPIRYLMPVITPPAIEELLTRQTQPVRHAEESDEDGESDSDDEDVDMIYDSNRSKSYPRLLRMRASLPPPKPDRLCFRTSIAGCTHAEVKNEIESQNDVKVTWLQFDPISLLSPADSQDPYQEYRCMWIFELSNREDISKVMTDGFLLRGARMNIRVLDEVYEEEFRAYSLCNEIYNEHRSKKLAKAGFKRKMALITK